jgi:hypothetical protein
LNFPAKRYGLPVTVFCLTLVVIHQPNSGMEMCAGLNFIALFAALFYGSPVSPTILGKELSFFQYRHDNTLGNIFPIKGRVIKSTTLSGEADWLLIRLNHGFEYENALIEHVLVRRNDKQPIVPNKANQLVYFKLVPDVSRLCDRENDKSDFPNEVWALCK